AAKLEVEADGGRCLEERLQVLATEVAALRGSGHETLPVVVAKPEAVAAASSGTAGPAGTAEGVTSMEYALVAAGIDATTATEIRRRRDESSLSEIYLRDQATREDWLDTPD